MIAMKHRLSIFLFAFVPLLAFALEVANPVTYLASRTDLSPEEHARLVQVGFKRIEVDISGDGKLDMLLCHDDPATGNATEAQSRAQEGGLLPWDVFVKKADNTGYVANTGPVADAVLGLGTPVSLNPEEVHIGQISEIGRFGIIALQIENPREGPSKSTIWAYTWEGDRLQSHKLAEYETGHQNALFDKYLAEGKRTVLQVQQVNP